MTGVDRHINDSVHHLPASLGICIKTLEKKVLFQNEACIKKCGVKLGTMCHEGCMKHYPTISNKSQLQGVSNVECGQLHATEQDAYESVVINNGDTLVTILCPVESGHENILRHASQMGLTKGELVILRHKLDKRTNRQIARILFISIATLKTHLNHIYKKLSPELNLLVKSLNSRP